VAIEVGQRSTDVRSNWLLIDRNQKSGGRTYPRLIVGAHATAANLFTTVEPVAGLAATKKVTEQPRRSAYLRPGGTDACLKRSATFGKTRDREPCIVRAGRMIRRRMW
jgi:hypothetical protein